MDTVICKHCGRNVVPRLLHQHADLQERTNEHICPLCGKIMYSTGGEPSVGGWAVYALIACALCYGLIATIIDKFKPPEPIPPIACKGSAAQCKAIAIKQK